VPHELGAHVGGMHDLESLRMRCVCDPDTGCWHLRSARGRKMPDDKRHVVWVHPHGFMTATRAAWLFATGKMPPPDKLVVRKCSSYDCVFKAHLACMTKAEHGAHLTSTGKTATPTKRLANRVQGQRRSRVSAELRQWISESEQTAMAVAHAVGIAPSWVAALRKQTAQRRWVVGG
jgi:hypothetical protein